MKSEQRESSTTANSVKGMKRDLGRSMSLGWGGKGALGPSSPEQGSERRPPSSRYQTRAKISWVKEGNAVGI